MDNSLWIMPRPIEEEPVPEEPNDAYDYLCSTKPGKSSKCYQHINPELPSNHECLLSFSFNPSFNLI